MSRLPTYCARKKFKWYQRLKAQLLVQGDDNVRYLHMLVNGKHRKKRIFTLGQDEGRIKESRGTSRYFFFLPSITKIDPFETRWSDRAREGEIYSSSICYYWW